MIYLHKLLPLLVMPIFMCCVLLVYALIRRRRWPIAIAIALLLVTSNQWVASRLLRSVEMHEVRQPASPQTLGTADAIVVLSGMVRNVAGPYNTLVHEWGDAADRFDGGLALWHANVAPKLLFTGARMPWSPGHTTEGDVLRQWALERGVPASAMAVTGVVDNTAQEARAVRSLLEGARVNSASKQVNGQHTADPTVHHIVLVTSAFHMPRAQALFERAGLQVTPYRVDFRVGVRATNPYDWLPSAQAADDFEMAWRELLARGFYGLQAWLVS